MTLHVERNVVAYGSSAMCDQSRLTYTIMSLPKPLVGRLFDSSSLSTYRKQRHRTPQGAAPRDFSYNNHRWANISRYICWNRFTSEYLLINTEEFRLGPEGTQIGRYVGQVLIPWKLVVKAEHLGSESLTSLTISQDFTSE